VEPTLVASERGDGNQSRGPCVGRARHRIPGLGAPLDLARVRAGCIAVRELWPAWRLPTGKGRGSWAPREAGDSVASWGSLRETGRDWASDPRRASSSCRAGRPIVSSGPRRPLLAPAGPRRRVVKRDRRASRSDRPPEGSSPWAHGRLRHQAACQYRQARPLGDCNRTPVGLSRPGGDGGEWRALRGRLPESDGRPSAGSRQPFGADARGLEG
jgi:hypothetical protein